MRKRISIACAVLLAAPLAFAQLDRSCTSHLAIDPCVTAECAPQPAPEPNPLEERLHRYAELEGEHQLSGLASYYSTFFDGRQTANGEIYRNRKYSAAHLTLPLGCWIEVKARATGKKLRMRVNDRGPFVKKFMLDLSQAAARYLGLDIADDRHVEVHVIALPGEEPLPDDEVVDVAAGFSPGS